MIDKRWLIPLGILLMIGSAYAVVTIFTDAVEIQTVNTRAFVVQENFPSPKDHFRVDSTAGGHVYTTTIESIGAPNVSVGTPSNPMPIYTNKLVGQIDTLTANRGYTCDDLCDTLDGVDYTGSNWSCIKATEQDATASTCNSTTLERNCVCKN